MAFDERFLGCEFDWFALDQNNQIGLFSTAGFGNVPASVQQNYQAHDAIISTLHLPQQATVNCWQDYEKYGLYIFDWQVTNGSYLRVGEPYFYQVMSTILKDSILKINGLPRINVQFSETQHIEIEA